MSDEGFKAALGSWASGVSVVTTNDHGMLYGLTVSSFSSLSLDPPLVLVCLHNENRLAQMIGQGGAFAVSVLAAGQEPASRYFARPGRVPTVDFTEIEGDWTQSGQPVIKGAIAWLVCTLHAQIPEGDHTIVVGRVVECYARTDGEPLVYWRRAYRAIVPSGG
jgi:flavin reductase (DIM6/NTAB) family NADH-FMN oxidoreductase RutF